MESKVKSFILNHPAKSSLGIVLLIFAACLLILNPAYTSNDDAYFSMAISGFFTGNPIPDIMVFNIILTNTWVVLYKLVPTINWYFWVQIACLYISISVITYVLLKLKSPFSYLFIPLQVLITAISLSYLQFTSTGIYLMVAGYCLLFFNLYGNRSWLLIFAAIGLITIGSFFRWFVFQAGLAITLPIIVVLIWMKRVQLRQTILPYILITLLYLVTQAIHRNYYNDNKEVATTEYYKNAEDLVNNPLKIESEVLKKAGWTDSDWTMFDAWFAIDNKVFSNESVIYINTHATKNIDIKRASSILLKGFKHNYLFYLFLGVLFVLIIVMSGKLELFDLLIVGLYISLAIALVLLARYRFYVFFPLAYFMVILQLLLKQNTQLDLTFKVIPLLFALIGIIYLSFNNRVNYVTTSEFTNHLNEYDKNKVYVLMPHGNEIFSNYFSSHPSVSPNQFYGQNYIPLGSLSTMPIYDKLMEKHGINNLSDNLINSEIIYLSDEYDVAFDAYIKHMKKHYDKTVSIDSISKAGKTSIFKVNEF